MKRNFSMKKITLLLALLATFIVGNLATAQEIPAAKIIVVDTRLIGSNSAVAQDMQRQITQIQNEMASEIEVQNTALRTEQQEIEQQRALLPQEVFEQRNEEFRLKVSQHQQSVQQKQLRLERALIEANEEVQRILKPILQNVLRETGATMMVEKSNVMEQIPGLDVTTRVIEQLDLELPTLNIEVPEEASAIAPVAAPAQ